MVNYPSCFTPLPTAQKNRKNLIHNTLSLPHPGTDSNVLTGEQGEQDDFYSNEMAEQMAQTEQTTQW